MCSCLTLALEAVLGYTSLGQEVKKTLLSKKVIKPTSLEVHMVITQTFSEAEMITYISETLIKKYSFEKPYIVPIENRDTWSKKKAYPKGVLKYNTDGSRLDCRAGFGVYGPGAKLAVPLGIHATAFQAEVMAMKAFRVIKKQTPLPRKAQKVFWWGQSPAVEYSSPTAKDLGNLKYLSLLMQKDGQHSFNKKISDEDQKISVGLSRYCREAEESAEHIWQRSVALNSYRPQILRA
ncbi:hypothetical protein J6590_082589 [Homalodisca vitripennis]|nr:hypothetical protein J6590_082589 [Homalodisca vitripennis]